MVKVDDEDFVNITVSNIISGFHDEIDQGIIEIIQPSPHFYPNFSSINTENFFGDHANRVIWRTKQNYDYAYLWEYAQNKGVYYLNVC